MLCCFPPSDSQPNYLTNQSTNCQSNNHLNRHQLTKTQVSALLLDAPFVEYQAAMSCDLYTVRLYCLYCTVCTACSVLHVLPIVYHLYC